MFSRFLFDIDVVLRTSMLRSISPSINVRRRKWQYLRISDFFCFNHCLATTLLTLASHPQIPSSFVAYHGVWTGSPISKIYYSPISSSSPRSLHINRSSPPHLANPINIDVLSRSRTSRNLLPSPTRLNHQWV